MRSEFGFGNLRRYFEQVHPIMAPAFISLYEVSIDFGAHPYEAGFSISTSIREENGQRFIDTVYLHEDGLPPDFARKNVARVGLWTAMAFSLIYPELYAGAAVSNVMDGMVSNY